ncbi:programmed cell death protein 2 isoform X2 [Protopterus annectens]|uniref:programmed cell death protein 2 isoform X2 n=1 Tax=Protopterus annectens TaxID=7888 RepID=UPI001CF9B5C7|nr:programmed cell death protein 2 isoform X2 [Protopterus annectens]
MAGVTRDSSVVQFGFVEEAVEWRLRSSQFPSKVGGKPSWLSLCELPGPEELSCELCGQPCVFLLQVYAPVPEKADCFHRTVFVFCCRNVACYSFNDRRSFKVFRSQLPRRNDFYSYDPPPDEPLDDVEGEGLGNPCGVELCRVCGCLGPKICSRCHVAHYCSKDHQVMDWKAGHKKSCVEGGSKETGVSTFLFPENELVVEPEEMQPATDPEREPESSTEPAAQLAVDNITVPDFASNCLDEKELEAMAKSESEEDKVFQHFKQRIAIEPEQVLRYSRGGSPLWVSAKNVPQQESIPHCICGAERIFEFQVMPQLLNHLNVDTLDTSIDWGTLAVYTCAESCDTDNKYVPEFLWKQDYSH